MLSTAVFELLYITTAAALFAVPHILPRYLADHDPNCGVYFIFLLSLSNQLVYKKAITVMLPLAHVGLTGNKYRCCGYCYYVCVT